MRGNIDKQLASLALLLLLLVAVTIPVMATEGDGGAADTGEVATDPTEGGGDASDGDPADVIEVPPADDGETVDTVLDDTVSSGEDIKTTDEGLPTETGEYLPAADDELIYMTAYGANCHAAVNTACQESRDCGDGAEDTTGCTAKTTCAGGTNTCAKSSCSKA